MLYNIAVHIALFTGLLVLYKLLVQPMLIFIKDYFNNKHLYVSSTDKASESIECKLKPTTLTIIRWVISVSCILLFVTLIVFAIISCFTGLPIFPVL